MSMESMMTITLLALGLCGSVCSYIASRKSRSVFLWFFFGAFSGPAVIFVVLFLLLSPNLEPDGTACKEGAEPTPRNALIKAARYALIFGLCYAFFFLYLIGFTIVTGAEPLKCLADGLINWTIKPFGKMGFYIPPVVAFVVLFMFYLTRHRSK